MRVRYIQRRKGEFWSIEEVFQAVIGHLPDGIQSTLISAPAAGANLASIVRNLWWARSQDGPVDLFHVTGDIHYVVLALTGAPVILTVHDLRFLEETRGMKRFLLWLLWVYLPGKAAGRLTAISEETKQGLSRFAGISPERIQVIPNPVAADFQPRAKEWNADRPVLLHVGTTSNKNLDRVIEVCSGLRVQLCILGKVTPAQRQALEVAGIACDSYCDLATGEVVELYRQCDLVVFPSLYEGFGMPILEGQAVGRPVLTSDRSPMREVAGGGALLVDPQDVKSIRDGLIRLLQDADLRSDLVRRGFENVKRYSPESVAAQYAEVYREVVRGP